MLGTPLALGLLITRGWKLRWFTLGGKSHVDGAARAPALAVVASPAPSDVKPDSSMMPGYAARRLERWKRLLLNDGLPPDLYWCLPLPENLSTMSFN
uniref:Uncharacterized protein n=1 Tax=Oryza glumipatula TaxID=40148 RepID=A0A0D9YWY5_9ORYZ